MKISFYVLSDNTSSGINNISNSDSQISDTTRDADALLKFVCKLIQTVLAKSEQTLVILDDNQQRLMALDKQLWQLSPTDFIPHDLHLGSSDNHVAPVVLTDSLPNDFEGIILNLSALPINLRNSNTTLHTASKTDSHDQPIYKPSRLLEIIPADGEEKEKGRLKYKHYKSLGLQLDYHPIGS